MDDLYATSSFLHHFKPFCEFKLELQSRKQSIWVKISYFLLRVTLKLERWPWKTKGHIFYGISTEVHHFIAISEFKLELQSGNTQFGSKLAIFCSVGPWNLIDDFKKQKGISSIPLQALCIILWIHTGVTVQKLPNWDKICFDLYDLDLGPLTLAFCMDITFVNGLNSWKFHDDTNTGTLWKRCYSRQIDGQMDGLTEVFLELLGHS